MNVQDRVKRGATKKLDKAPKNVRRAVMHAIGLLASNPRPNGCKKLQGGEGYRIRVGEWRVIYTIEDDRLVVTVVRIRPRGSAY